MNLIKKLSRRVIELPTLTELARAEGEIGQDEAVTVTIRKIPAGEIAALLDGNMIEMITQHPQREDESDREYSERIAALRLADAEELGDNYAKNWQMMKTVISHGVVSHRVVEKPDEDPESNEISIADFGADTAYLFSEIMAFTSGRSRKQVNDLARFPADGDGLDDGGAG